MCDRAAHIEGGGDLNANKLKSNITKVLKIFHGCETGCWRPDLFFLAAALLAPSGWVGVF